ncbi:hypothetical protein ACFIOY_05420 [Bradyrhizobium sp. TZ2]
MFSFFKKKQPTAMDAAARAIYGDKPPAKSADLEQAILLAHEVLLFRQVPFQEVRSTAAALFDGPLPYSTHDLAVAASLSFFRGPQHHTSLADVQIAARVRVLDWMKEGKVAPSVTQIFEDALYRTFKNVSTGEEGSERTRFASEQARLAEFKRLNTGRSIREVAKTVKEFMLLHNMIAERAKPDDPDEEQLEHAHRIELAFLIGATRVAAEAFSIREQDERLLLLNIMGTYFGMDLEPAEAEIEEAFDACEAEEEATRIGGAAMFRNLLERKMSPHEGSLAELQKRCWSPLPQTEGSDRVVVPPPLPQAAGVPILSADANEREYVAWFVKHSPECALLRSWIGGDMDKFANVIANLCEKQRAKADTPDKLFAKLLDLSVDYSERMLPVLNARGGLERLLAMPPELINATIQVLAQIIVFKEILITKYNHKEAKDVFQLIDAAEKSRA